MGIYFDSQNKIFYLESKEITYAFGINKIGVLEHLYFGKRVGRDLAFGTYSQQGRSHPIYWVDDKGNKYDMTVIPKEVETPYSGDYYEPSLMLEYANGNRRSDLVFEGYEIFKNKISNYGYS